MDKDFMESMIKVNQTWVPLAKYRTMKAQRRRELVKGACFIVLITVVMYVGLMWVGP